jgi:hypothetical protein
MDMTTLANPFRIWAELARGLRERFAEELGEPPYAQVPSEILTAIGSIAMRCDTLSASLKRLNGSDPKAYDAFVRALEKS